MNNCLEGAICVILNNPNSKEIQTNFQKIKSYMKKQEDYKQVLSEYEVAGLEIAKSLTEDYLKFRDKDIINMIFNSYIVPINTAITDNQLKDAISKLSQMTYALEDYYNISAYDIKENEKQLKMEPLKNVKVKKLGTYPGYKF